MCLLKLPTETVEEDHVEEEREPNVAIEEETGSQSPYLPNTVRTCVKENSSATNTVSHLSFSDQLRVIEQLKWGHHIQLLQCI